MTFIAQVWDAEENEAGIELCPQIYTDTVDAVSIEAAKELLESRGGVVTEIREI